MMRPGRTRSAVMGMKDKLQSVLDGFVGKGIVGASSCIVRPGAAPVAAAAGLADRPRGIAVTPDHLFKIGSVTKTFVAVTLMRLAEDHVVDLAAPIAGWFPSLP